MPISRRDLTAKLVTAVKVKPEEFRAIAEKWLKHNYPGLIKSHVRTSVNSHRGRLDVTITWAIDTKYMMKRWPGKGITKKSGGSSGRVIDKSKSLMDDELNIRVHKFFGIPHTTYDGSITINTLLRYPGGREDHDQRMHDPRLELEYRDISVDPAPGQLTQEQKNQILEVLAPYHHVVSDFVLEKYGSNSPRTSAKIAKDIVDTINKHIKALLMRY